MAAMLAKGTRLDTIRPWQSAIDEWLGKRRYCIHGPSRLANATRWVALVMSHRHRHPEHRGQWRHRIERILRWCRDTQAAPLLADDTPMGGYLLHAAKRFKVECVELCLPGKHETMADWEERVSSMGRNVQGRETESGRLEISPLEMDACEPSAGPLRDIRLVDRTLVALADCVQVVSLRPDGRTERLLHERLKDDRFPKASIYIGIDDRDQYELALLDRGAVGWRAAVPSQQDRHRPIAGAKSESEKWLPHVGSDVVIPATSAVPLIPRVSPSISLRIRQGTWRYLTHCTRGRSGQWPDQSLRGYFDELIVAPLDSDVSPSPLDTLERVLTQMRLVASSRLNRTDHPTVSLTEIPIDELMERRCFQSHLGRWDWEPYGICIDRTWLAGAGARPVLYSDTVSWKELSEVDRAFYQPTCDDQSLSRHDWSSEREWRMIGDLHLRDIPFEKAIVFVPTPADADRIARICRFPILALRTP